MFHWLARYAWSLCNSATYILSSLVVLRPSISYRRKLYICLTRHSSSSHVHRLKSDPLCEPGRLHSRRRDPALKSEICQPTNTHVFRHFNFSVLITWFNLLPLLPFRMVIYSVLWPTVRPSYCTSVFITELLFFSDLYFENCIHVWNRYRKTS